MTDEYAAEDAAEGFLAAWASLASDLRLGPELSRTIGLELVARHSEPHRHYHTTRHIEAVLGHLDHLHGASQAARLAAFFHDVIYDPSRADNEEQSAAFARQTLAAAGVAETDDVSAIVLATRDHTLPPDGPRETAPFLDADLAILGAPSSAYDEYVTAIRAEYSHVAEPDFRVGRLAVLNRFLERKSLYFTNAGRASWEVRARANLRRERAVLADP